MGKQDKVYLAHEFINEGWEALYVTQTMANFAEAKLTFIGSASLIENRIDLCVPKDLQESVREAPDVGMRELLKDYVVNKQFRRDVYIKGPQQLSPRDQRQRFAEIAFATAWMNKEFPEKFQLPIGELAPKKETYSALLAAVSGKVCTGGELLATAEKAGLREPDTMLLLLLLVNAGVIQPARPDHAKVDRSASHRLNGLIMETTASADTHRFFASPVLGSSLRLEAPPLRPLRRRDHRLLVDHPGIAGQHLARRPHVQGRAPRLRQRRLDGEVGRGPDMVQHGLGSVRVDQEQRRLLRCHPLPGHRHHELQQLLGRAVQQQLVAKAALTSGSS